MKIIFLFITVLVFFNKPLPDPIRQKATHIDTSRFTLKRLADHFQLFDTLVKDSVKIENDLLFNSSDDIDETAYTSSFEFSDKVTAFEIGDNLFGLHVASFSVMKEGSAQAASGRDIFLAYNPSKKSIINTVLDFGITKQRSRYLGCLSATSSHFLLADVNNDGLMDIGRIREELQCVSEKEDMVSGPFFIQNGIEWFIFSEMTWHSEDIDNANVDYSELPLIGIKMNPVDFFGFIKWKSYDPKMWDNQSKIYFYPQYRRQLIINNN